MIETALGVSAIVMTVGFAQAQYTTGFESPPFSSGTINAQDSWISTITDRVRVLSGAEIATELGLAGNTVHGGLQAFLVSGAGGSGSAYRNVSGLGSSTSVSLDVWARPLAPTAVASNIGNIFLTMESSTSVRFAAFRFGYYDNGSGSAAPHIDYASSASSIWQDTGLSWAADTWYNIKMSADFSTHTYDFFLNGAKVNTSPIAFYYNTGNAVNDFGLVRVFRGSNQAGMIVDDLAIVPEPSVAALLLVGGCALLLRRKR